jgi:MFS family permease
MLMGFILPLCIVPVFTILPPIYAQDVFHGGPEVLGFLLSAIGIGGIIGGIVIALLSKIERRGLLQIGALFLLSVTSIGFALCTNLWSALLLLVLAGFFEIIFLTTNQTLLQLSIPNEIRGCVTSIVNLNRVLLPLGGLIAGFGSDLLNGPKGITIILGSIGALISVAILFGSPTIRNYRISQGMKTNFANTGTNSDNCNGI